MMLQRNYYSYHYIVASVGVDASTSSQAVISLFRASTLVLFLLLLLLLFHFIR